MRTRGPPTWLRGEETMEALYGGALHRRVTIVDLAAAKKRGENGRCSPLTNQ
jgi:hypothetical protein